MAPKAKTIKNDVLQDDGNLLDHRQDQFYWYSIEDGIKLLLWIRQSQLSYIESPVTLNQGEEYAYFRENTDRILLTDPYHSSNFVEYLKDDIARITTSGHIGSNMAWTVMPTTIIIPVLSGLHWRTVVIKVNYDQQTVNVLFDDPYGVGAFPQDLQTVITTALKSSISKLIQTEKHIGDVDFILADDHIQTTEKLIDQQGHGKNSWDCGPITFSNIKAYVKQHQENAEKVEYFVPEYNADTHNQKILEVRSCDGDDYSNVVGIPLASEGIIGEIKSQIKQNTVEKIRYVKQSDLLAAQVEVLDSRHVLDIPGMTPLHTASKIGDFEVVQELLSIIKKSDINVQDGSGKTALHYAAQNGHLEVAKELLKMTKPYFIYDRDGQTAIHLAAKGGYVEMVDLLSFHGMGIWLEDTHGKRLLKTAIEAHRIEVLEYLIKSGADVNRDISMPFVVYASQKNHWNIVEWLVDNKAVVFEKRAGKCANILRKCYDNSDFHTKEAIYNAVKSHGIDLKVSKNALTKAITDRFHNNGSIKFFLQRIIKDAKLFFYPSEIDEMICGGDIQDKNWNTILTYTMEMESPQSFALYGNF